MSEINDYTQFLPELVVIKTIFHILSTVFYFYGLRKWVQLQEHFMIQQRFPAVSKLIVLLSYVGCTLTFIRRCVQLQHNNALYLPPNKNSIEYILWIAIIQSSGQSLSFFVYGLINLRLLLIYLRWKRNKSKLQNREANVRSMCASINELISAMPHRKYENIYYNPFCILICLFTMIGSLYMTLYRLFGDIDSAMIAVNSTFWTAMLLINIVIMCVIFCKKAKDGIGCLRETVIMLCYVLLTTIITPLAYTHGSLIFPSMAILSTIPFFQGFFPLFIPLYYIYKMEGTLDVTIQKQNNKQRIFNHIQHTKVVSNTS
eukprot:296788_1